VRIGLLSILVLLAIVAPAAAQPAPAPCEDCARGDVLIEKFSLQPLRSVAADIAGMPLGGPLSSEQYARVLQLRERTPALTRLGALDDADLSAIAASLCRGESSACTEATTRALRCLADRCAVDLLTPHDPRNVDLVEIPSNCHQYSTPRRSPPYGLGMDWGNGWQRSRYPTDGHAWSFGIEGRMRFGRRFGAVARVDRVAGRDEATDTDHNGKDDLSTGSITRIAALVGPSFVLDNTRYDSTTRSLRLDLLGGYVSTRSQPNESGLAAGADLSLQLSIFRIGVRFVQGTSDADHATMLLAHLGILAGSAPPYRDATDCGAETATRSSRLALGFDIPIAGYGISEQLGYLSTGLGVETLYHLSRSFDALARADLLLYPGHDRDRVIHQAVLAGVRIDHKSSHAAETGFFSTVLGGYSYGSGLTPTTTGAGPIVDLAFGWGGQGPEGSGYLRLHGRFGVGPDNLDYRAIFLSAGFELRFDPRSWRDRT
jgi:hypothetical protein